MITAPVPAAAFDALEARLRELTPAELDALRRAVRAAREVNPLDEALVALAIVADVAAEPRTVH